MATDLGPFGDASQYTQVVSRLDDGEAFNAQAINNFLLPIINRTEYLKQRLDEPTASTLIFDDFLNGRLTSDSDLATAHSYWQQAESGTQWTESFAGRDDGSIGQMLLSPSGAAIGNYHLYHAFTNYNLAQVRELQIRFKVQDVSLSGLRVECGFYTELINDTEYQDAAEHGVGLLFRGGSGCYVRSTTGGASSALAIPSSSGTNDTYLTLKLTHDGAGVWQGSINGGTPVQAATNIPASSLGTTLHLKVEVPSSGSRIVTTDFVLARVDGSARFI